MTRTTAHSQSLWTRRLSISKVRCPPFNVVFSCLFFSSLWCHHWLIFLVSFFASTSAVHLLPLSLSLSSFPPRLLKTWIGLLSYQETHAHRHLHNVIVFPPILWNLCKLCEVGLACISVDKQDLFHCKLEFSGPNEQVRVFFFFSPPDCG